MLAKTKENDLEMKVQELVLKSARKSFISKVFQPVNFKKPVKLGPLGKQNLGGRPSHSRED